MYGAGLSVVFFRGKFVEVTQSCVFRIFSTISWTPSPSNHVTYFWCWSLQLAIIQVSRCPTLINLIKKQLKPKDVIEQLKPYWLISHKTDTQSEKQEFVKRKMLLKLNQAGKNPTSLNQVLGFIQLVYIGHTVNTCLQQRNNNRQNIVLTWTLYSRDTQATMNSASMVLYPSSMTVRLISDVER